MFLVNKNLIHYQIPVVGSSPKLVMIIRVDGMEEFVKLMVPDGSPSSSPLTPAATLAFIDLETTGLPFDVGKKNIQITELAIVAIDRSDFDCDTFLRVANKINLFIRPRSMISFGASSVTGLYNDILDAQKPFDNSIPQLINTFFSRLRSPVCLLAHNGKRFDFPVLKAELQRIGASLPADVTCADTLQAFRTFGLVLPTDRHNLTVNPSFYNNKSDDDLVKITNMKFTDLEVDKLLSDDIECFEGIISEDQPVTAITKNCNPLLNSSLVGFGDKTPEKLPEKDCPQLTRVKHVKQFDISSLPKRKLFRENCLGNGLDLAQSSNVSQLNDEKPPSKKRPHYSLEKLYMHYFGAIPVGSHCALADCSNLAKVCQNVRDSFLPWVNENQVLFSDISSMW